MMGVVTFVGLIVLRQQCYAGEDGVSSEGAAAIDWMSEMQKGGATGIALIILAVAAVLFAIERFINMRRSNILGSSDVVNQAINMGSESNVEAAQALYEKNPSSFTKVVNHMAEHSDYDPAEIMETAAELRGRRNRRSKLQWCGCGAGGRRGRGPAPHWRIFTKDRMELLLCCPVLLLDPDGDHVNDAISQEIRISSEHLEVLSDGKSRPTFDHHDTVTHRESWCRTNAHDICMLRVSNLVLTRLLN